MGVAIVVALASQFSKSMKIAGFGPIDFFSYFTVLSNVAAAVVLLVEAGRPGVLTNDRWNLVRGAVTLYMAITGIVYNLLLAPASADVGLTARWVDVLVHIVGPVVVVLLWVVDPPNRRPTMRAAAVWLVFPIVYLVYSLVRGPIADWYPYPFLNPGETGTTQASPHI